MGRIGKLQKDTLRNILIVGATSVVILLIVTSSILFTKNRINNNIKNQPEIAQNFEGEIVNSESASTEIGKTVEEAKKQIEEISKNNAKEAEEKTENTNSNKSDNNKNSDTEKEQNKVANAQKQETKTESKKEQTQKAEEKKQIKFTAPVKGEIIREFASDSLVFSETLQEWITHKGVDIKADKTTVVAAACDGTVQSIKNDPRYGLTVIINHEDGYQTIYSNLLTAEFVVAGEKVEAGQTIGTVGNTASFEINDGYHLHFEVLKDNEYQDPTILINF